MMIVEVDTDNAEETNNDVNGHELPNNQPGVRQDTNEDDKAVWE